MRHALARDPKKLPFHLGWAVLASPFFAPGERPSRGDSSKAARRLQKGSLRGPRVQDSDCERRQAQLLVLDAGEKAGVEITVASMVFYTKGKNVGALVAVGVADGALAAARCSGVESQGTVGGLRGCLDPRG